MQNTVSTSTTCFEAPNGQLCSIEVVTMPNFDSLWAAYQERVSSVGVGDGTVQPVSEHAARKRFSEKHVWGFVSVADLKIFVCVERSGAACAADVIGFFAHEMDHILRPAATQVESERNAQITADCARVAVWAVQDAYGIENSFDN